METSDVFEKGRLISDMFDNGEVSAKEISLASERDNGIGEGNPNMYDINGLSDVMETKGMNDSLADSRDISDIAEVVEGEVMEKSNVVESSSLHS